MAQGDRETDRLLGELMGAMKAVQEKQDRMEKKLDGVVAMTNRWKGATTIIIILGGVIGWGSNILLKLAGYKA